MKLNPIALTIDMKTLSPGLNKGGFEIPLKEIDWNIDEVEPKGDHAFIDLEIDLTDRCIICNGTLDAIFVTPCARCLEQADFTITEKIYGVYSWDDRLSDEIDTEPVPLGGKFSILNIIREAVVLSIPVKPLCTPDCQGLCYN